MKSLFVAGLVIGVLVHAGPDDPITIPDPAFRQALIERYDANHDGQISVSEAASVQAIYFSNRNIGDITGIQHFVNLKELDVARNHLTALPDLSALRQLTSLVVNHNSIEALPSLDALTSLRWLYIFNNRLTDLPDLSHNTGLTRLLVLNNRLTYIQDLSHLTGLQWLWLHYNELSYIPDVSGLPALTQYLVQMNPVTESRQVCETILAHDHVAEFVYQPMRNAPVLPCDCAIEVLAYPADQTVCFGVEAVLAVDVVDKPFDGLTVSWFRAGRAEPVWQGLSYPVGPLTPPLVGDYFAVVTTLCDSYQTPTFRLDAWRAQAENPCEQNAVFWRPSSAGLSLVEGLNKTALNVTLTRPPEASATVTLTAEDAATLAVHPDQIQIDAADWEPTRQFTLWAPEDGVIAQSGSSRRDQLLTAAFVSGEDQGSEDIPVTTFTNNAALNRYLYFDWTLRAPPGSRLRVPLWASWLPGDDVLSLGIGILYDTEMLTLVDVDQSGTLTDGWLLHIDEEPYPTTTRLLTLAGSQLAGDEGVLFYLEFEVADVAVDRQTTLGIQGFSMNDAPFPEYGSSSGAVKITDCLPGDLDGDLVIKPFDASVALHKVVGLEHGLIRAPDACADADCDGFVTGYDASLILAKGLGEDVTLCATPLLRGSPPMTLSAAPLQTPAEAAFALPLMISAVEEDAPLKGFQFGLSYDPDLVTLTGVETDGGLAADLVVLANDTRRGELIVAGYGLGVSGSGLFLTVLGQAGSIEGEVSLAWLHAGINDGSTPVVMEPLVVLVGESIGPERTSVFVFTTEGEPAVATPRVDDGPAEDRHVFEIVAPPLHGDLAVDLGSNGLRYTPDPGFLGQDLFVIRALDQLGRHVDGVGAALVVSGSYRDVMAAWPDGAIVDLVALLSPEGGAQ